jgi:hypothetical protein
MTRDDGVVLKLPDGSEFQMIIVEQEGAPMTDDLRYPFTIKAAIAAKLEAREADFVQQCIGIMQVRHAARQDS